MKHSLLSVAEQVSPQGDEQVARALMRLGDNIDEGYRRYIHQVYTDTEIHNIYEGLRAQYQYDRKYGPKTDTRPLVRLPSPLVWRFLNEQFAPAYGENWLTDKTILAKVVKTEPLMKPWIIGGFT